MNALPYPDNLHLESAQGWLELGNHLEAKEELEQIAPSSRVHPDVLELRWEICARGKKWEECADIGGVLVELAPDQAPSWIHRSFALHELKQTQDAYDLLVPAAGLFKDVWTIPYNLACYSSVLRKFEEAQDWLKKAMELEEGVKQIAQDDPDLKPMWDSIGGRFERKG